MLGPVRSVSYAFAILRLLAQSEPMSLSDICRLIDLSPSSCLNLLKTLVSEGAVERDGQTKYYRITKTWSEAEALRDGTARAMIDRAQQVMAHFAQANEAAVGLWKAVSQNRLGLIAHAESDAGMRLRLADAQRQPLGGGAVGRALAAAQQVTRTELERRYAPVRWQVELPFPEYERQVREAAEKGYAVDRGFAHRNITTVAVAIADLTPGYGVSASVLSSSPLDEDIDVLGQRLVSLRKSLTEPG